MKTALIALLLVAATGIALAPHASACVPNPVTCPGGPSIVPDPSTLRCWTQQGDPTTLRCSTGP